MLDLLRIHGDKMFEMAKADMALGHPHQPSRRAALRDTVDRGIAGHHRQGARVVHRDPQSDIASDARLSRIIERSTATAVPIRDKGQAGKPFRCQS